MAMHEGHSIEYTGKNGEDFILCELAVSLFNEFKEVPIGAVLHDKIDVGVVVEKAIEFNNVRVVQIHLNFNFTDEGHLYVLGTDHLFRY